MVYSALVKYSVYNKSKFSSLPLLVKNTYLDKYFLIVACILATSCTSIRPLADQTLTKESLVTQLKVDDRVRVLKKDGEEHRNFIIDSIEDTYLLGHTKEADTLIIPYSSIETVEIYQFNKGKTIALAVPILLLIGLIIATAVGGVPAP